MYLVLFLLAILAGAALCYLILRERLNAQRSQLSQLEPLREENARLLSTLGEMKGRFATVEAAKTEMANAFRAASSSVLRDNSTQFLELANERFERLKGDSAHDLGRRQQAIDELVKPLRQALEKVEQHVAQVEADRLGSYAVLTSQLKSLESETRKLGTALASPTARGRWGEIQLRRVVELAGMIAYCDFAEQPNDRRRGKPVAPRPDHPTSE